MAKKGMGTIAFCPVSLTCFFFLLFGCLHLITFDGWLAELGLNELAMSLETHRIRASCLHTPMGILCSHRPALSQLVCVNP